jgi:23S rRNA pseudouridine2605 synthase
MRLHRYMALCGIASRRKCEEIILEGRVEVNGEVVNTLGSLVEEGDTVTVDGKPLGFADSATYILNKPKGYLTTLFDPQNRATVKELIPEAAPNIKPVGRLDKDTSGLLLLTNDGDLAARITHPRYGVEKEYKVTVYGIPDERDLRRLREGVTIDGGRTAPALVDLIHADAYGRRATLMIVLHEGRKRQVRLMTEAVGHPTLELERVRIGFLRLKGMRPGECRKLGQADLARLKEMVGLDPDSKKPKPVNRARASEPSTD